MPHIRFLRGFSALALALLLANGARAGILINFDDLPEPPEDPGLAPVPNGYAGLNWTNFSYIDSSTLSGLPSGYTYGVTSGTNIAFNDNGGPANMTISGILPFDFLSGNFTAAWRDNLQIDVTASYNGIQLYSTTFFVDPTAPSFQTLNFIGIDSITFTSSGGTPHPGYLGNDPQFVVDDITINQTSAAVPEPASLSVLALGTLALLRRRRH